MGSVFFHIDLDAFFASVEMLDHPEYRGKPLIIGTPGPRHVASTCSYEARKYGVRSAMPMTTALKLCPDAICVHGRMERYAEKSSEVMSLIRDFAPGFLQVSVDEAFLDLTGMERIYPLPGKAARLLKESIMEKTGLTVSIGVAPSRYLAKLASDYRKPDGLTIIPRGKEEAFIDSIPLRKLWGIGDSMLRSLERRGIHSAAEIRSISMDSLVRMFGQSSGTFLFNASRGIDPGIYQGEAKSRSISTETTSPDWISLDASGHSSIGSPIFIELRKKMRANVAAMTQLMPDALIAIGACSREEPQPKFLPPTMISPSLTFLTKSLSISSMQCDASSLCSDVLR